jgi:hypothetical protein
LVYFTKKNLATPLRAVFLKELGINFEHTLQVIGIIFQLGTKTLLNCPLETASASRG